MDNLDEVAFSSWSPRVLRTITVVAPAAGADWSYQVPGEWIFKPWAIRAELVTSSAAANRGVNFQISDGNTVLMDAGAVNVQVASKTVDYNLADVGNAYADGSALHQFIPFTSPLIMRSGWKISSVTNLIDTADQWGKITLVGIVLETGQAEQMAYERLAMRAYVRGEIATSTFDPDNIPVTS